MKVKKSLGQNFLKSQLVINTMAKTASLAKNDVVVEIGPGKGALTEKLLAVAGKVIAIEMDGELVLFLQEKFSEEIKNGALMIIHGDALEISHLQKPLPKAMKALYVDTWKLVANIPYYITGAILKTYLSAQNQPSEMVLLMQKEVAERIVKRDKKESILSLAVALYGKATFIKKVAPSAFSPSPSIDSAILHIHSIGRNVLSPEKEEDFFTLMKQGFAHKRKQLLKNLGAKYDKKLLFESFTSCNIPHETRAEDVNIHKWICLLEKLL